MSDNSKRVSELQQSANVTSSDRVLILKSPSLNASVRTITVANLAATMTKATELSAGVVRVGAGIAVDANGTISAVGGLAVGVVTIDNQGQDTYTVAPNDSVILVNPSVVQSNVTIILPIADAVEGKEIIVKLIDAGSNYKVTVTTDDEGNAYLEDPITGAFDFGYDLVQSGQAETWIHDGNVYRHLGTARATPIFNVNANNYAQVVVRNASSGENASADLALYNDLGSYEAGTGPFIDIGIESSNYSNNLYGLYGPNDGYVYIDNNGETGGNLIIGTAGDRSILFHANGTNSNNRVMVVNSTYAETKIKVGNSYVIQYQTKNYWGVYPEDDDTYSNSAYSWIEAGLPNTNAPQFIIENKRADTNQTFRWTFNANGNIVLPNGGDIHDYLGNSVLGRLEIDGGNASTNYTAELTVDGGGA